MENIYYDGGEDNDFPYVLRNFGLWEIKCNYVFLSHFKDLLVAFIQKDAKTLASFVEDGKGGGGILAGYVRICYHHTDPDSYPVTIAFSHLYGCVAFELFPSEFSEILAMTDEVLSKFR